MDSETRAIELTSAKINETHVVAVLADGREIATPFSWYPHLRDASPIERARFEISPFGIHWVDLDEDLSIDGMLNGSRAPEDPRSSRA